MSIVRKRLAEPAYAHTLDVEGDVHLYVPHVSAEEDLAGEPLAVELQGQCDLYALDPRGLGESLPDEEGGFWQPYGLDYMFHGHGLMLGESYLGRRVLDVLMVMDLLQREGAQGLTPLWTGAGGAPGSLCGYAARWRLIRHAQERTDVVQRVGQRADRGLAQRVFSPRRAFAPGSAGLSCRSRRKGQCERHRALGCADEDDAGAHPKGSTCGASARQQPHMKQGAAQFC